MRLDPQGNCHLTCTNIHPGETWAEVRDNLERFLPAVKRQVSPGQDFGVGLRLSAASADALRDPETFTALRELLAANGLYVFTINGFPYGPFHGVRVKEEVYQPDWRDEARLAYTDKLATLLADLLPPDISLEGSVSTVPGGFKPLAADPAAVELVAAMMVRHAAHLACSANAPGARSSWRWSQNPVAYWRPSRRPSHSSETTCSRRNRRDSLRR